MCNLSNFAALV